MVWKVWNKATNQEELVADGHKFAEGVIKDTYAPELNKKFGVTTKDGARFWFPSDKIGDALKTGEYFPLSDNEMEAMGQIAGPVGALVAGMADWQRGISVGLSTLAYDEVDARIQGALKQEHPTISAVGEVVGFMMGLPIGATPAGLIGKAGTGAAGLASKAIASSLGKGVATRGVAAASTGARWLAGGAIEGALMGAGHALSEDAMFERLPPSQLASAVLEAAGWGALFGAGITGIGGALFKGGAMGLAKMPGREWAAAKIRGIAEKTGFQALGFGTKDFKALAQRDRFGMGEEAAAKFIREEGIIGASKTIDDNIARLQVAHESRAKAISTFNEQIEAALQKELGGAEVAAQGTQKGGRLAAESVAGQKMRELAVDGVAIAKKIRSFVQKEFEVAGKVSPAARTTHKRLLAEADRWESLQGVSFSDAAKFRSHYDPMLKWSSQTEDVLKTHLRRVRGIINEEIETKGAALAAKHLDAGSAAAFKTAKREYGISKDLLEVAENTLAKQKAEKILPSGMGVVGGAGMVGLGIGGGPGALVGGVVAASLYRGLAKRAPAIAHTLADKATKMKWLQSSATKMDKRIETGLTNFSKRALKKKRLKLPKFRPATIQKLNYSAGGMVGAKSTPKSESRQEAMQRHSRDLGRLVSDADKMQKAITLSVIGLGEIAPKAAQAVQERHVRAVQYLHSTLPKPIPTLTPTPFGSQGRVAEAEISKWLRAAQAIERPVETLLSALERGTLSTDVVAAIRAVDPDLHANISQRALEKVAAEASTMSFRDRAQLSILVGRPLDTALLPNIMAHLQAPPEMPPPPQAGGRSQKKKAPSTKGAEFGTGMATQAQRLEAT
jgi:hypothetical protein